MFVKDAINIGLNGTFAVWVGTLIDILTPLVLVCEPGTEEESVVRLARVGYENIRGYLDGGINAWIHAGKKTESVKSVSPVEFATQSKLGAFVLDVRKSSEADAGHVKGASIIPLSDLEKQLGSLDKEQEVFVHCAGGYRSMIAASMLKKNGFDRVINVHGGWGKIRETDVVVEKTPVKISN
jgi:hydroxyacylglutathione hydrolase